MAKANSKIILTEESRSLCQVPQIECLKLNDKEIVIWDISGQKRFREVVKSLIMIRVNLVVLVFDLSRRETLLDLKEWVEILTKKYDG